MTCFSKLRQTYMPAALNTKEAHDEQKQDEYDNNLSLKLES